MGFFFWILVPKSCVFARFPNFRLATLSLNHISQRIK